MGNNTVEYGIRIRVDGSRDSAGAFDEVTASTDRLGTTADKAGQSLRNINGQMTDTTVIMRQNAEAANLASEAAQKFLTPLQREVELFGASRAEQERYNAAKAGLSAAVQQQAAILGANIDALQRDEQAARSLAAQEDRNTKAADAFIAKLRDQVATLGMNTAQLQAHRAAQLGVTDAAAPLIKKLEETGAGAKGAGGHMQGFSLASAGARTEVLTLFHELSQGNFQRFGGSMMVLGERTGAAGLLFSAAGLGALGFVTAVAAVSYAVIKGANDQRLMNNALIETGGYAGVTSDALDTMAHSAVEAGGSIRESKKAVTELAASGKFTGDQIGYISEAAIAMEHATGKSIDATIKEFESLAVQTSGNTLRSTEAISRATLKLDDQYHFLTESVYEEIRALEKEGDQKGASKLATETLAKVTKERAEEMAGNIGFIQRGWNSVKEAILGGVDALGDWGKKATAASKVADLQKFVDYLRNDHSDGNLSDANRAILLQHALVNLTAAQKELNAANDAAAAKGKAAIAQSEAAHAASRIEQDDIKLGKKGMTELDDAIQKYGQDLAKIAAVNPASPLLGQDAVNAHIEALRKAHTPAPDKGNDGRAKVLQDALTQEQTWLDGEKSIFDAREKMLDMYHQKFSLSDTDFYSGRAAARAEYIASEAIAFAKEASLVQNSVAKTPAEVAARKAKYDELVKAHQKFVDDMRNATGADVVAQTAAADAVVKASDDAINKYLGSLDQEAQKLEDANKGHEVSTAAVERETMARLDLAIAYQKQFMAEQVANGATVAELAQSPAILKYLEDQREAHERIAKALDQADVDKATKLATQKATQEWDTTAKHIESTLADAIMNGGADAWKKLRAAIAQTVLQVPLQYVGSLGASIMAPGAPQAGSGASSAVGAAQSAANLYKLSAGGLNGLGTAAANGYDSMAGMFGPGTIGSTGPSATASAIGQYVPVVAVAVASYLAARAVSGGYKVEGIGNVLNLGGIVGGLANRAFGMGDKQITGESMRGTISDAGLTGQNFTDWMQKGGWFRSDKHGETPSDFSADTTKQFTQGFATLEAASSGFAQAIGLSADALKGYSKDFNITLGNDAAANQKAITDFFGTVGDEMANRLVPGLDQFSLAGESASATLQRLAQDFKTTDQVAQLLGTSAAKMFGGTGMDSAAAREQLVKLAGGADVLSQQAAFFSQNYMTEAQRIAPVKEAVDAAMASLGLAGVKTRKEFADIAQGLDKTTQAGATQFVAMMQLEEAFAQVYPAIEDTASALKSMQDAAAQLLGGVDTAFSVLQGTVDRQKTALSAAHDAQDQAIQAQVDAATAAQGKVKSLADALHGALDSMTSAEDAAVDRAKGQAQILTALAIARAGGPLPDADQLKTALSAANNFDSSQFSSYADYRREFLTTRNAVSDLAGMSDSSASVAQKTLDTLNAQKQATDLAYQAEVDRLDSLVEAEKEKIDILKGQSTTLLSIDDAMAGLQEAILAASGNPINAATAAVNQAYQMSLGRAPDAAGLAYWQQQAAAGSSTSNITDAIEHSPEAQIRDLYESLLGRAPDAAGLQYWMSQESHGASIDAIHNEMMQGDEYQHLHPVPAFAGGGEEAVGPQIVGANGPGIEATSSSRITTSQTVDMSSGQANSAGSNGALLEKLDNLTKKVEALIEPTQATARATGQHAEHFARVSNNGNTLLVENA